MGPADKMAPSCCVHTVSNSVPRTVVCFLARRTVLLFSSLYWSAGPPSSPGKTPKDQAGGACNSAILEAEASRLLELGSSRPTWATWKDSYLKQEKEVECLSVCVQAHGCPSGLLRQEIPSGCEWLDPSRPGFSSFSCTEMRQD